MLILSGNNGDSIFVLLIVLELIDVRVAWAYGLVILVTDVELWRAFTEGLVVRVTLTACRSMSALVALFQEVGDQMLTLTRLVRLEDLMCMLLIWLGLEQVLVTFSFLDRGIERLVARKFARLPPGSSDRCTW